MAEYERNIRTNWRAHRIWARAEELSKNIWLLFDKTVQLETVPATLAAHIAAENKYWLYINGVMALRDGGLKRGPTPTGCYYDTTDIAPYLRPGENRIRVLVWYFGAKTSFSCCGCDQGSLLFEAGDILSDSTWLVSPHPAYLQDTGEMQPNFRIPERNILYDARLEQNFNWAPAREYDPALWGDTYAREIPLFKDYGLKSYENQETIPTKVLKADTNLTMRIPHNAHCTPWLKVEAPAGKTIVITTDNTAIGAVHDTYITKEGLQEFEALSWFNGEEITYSIPAGVRVLDLRYRESGYDSEFRGEFSCSDPRWNRLWNKSQRTLYVTMRDTFMDCPDRERAQWWGDVTNEMVICQYALDRRSDWLYKKGVRTMLSFIDPRTKVMQTVVPIHDHYFELPAQQLAGICGFWTYYMYTGDASLIKEVYRPSIDYVNLWSIGADGLVIHRPGSWDWLDWGSNIDVVTLENAWYYYALSRIRNMANLLGDSAQAVRLTERMSGLYNAYQKLWVDGAGYMSTCILEDNHRKTENPTCDERGDAIAVLAGLCPEEKYPEVTQILFQMRNSSPYMEYYVQEALCRMGEFEKMSQRTLERYGKMIADPYSTLDEVWDQNGSKNHGWSGGSLVAASRYLAGIQPTAPGWEEAEIAPHFAGLTKISCLVPTCRGDIRLNARIENGSEYLDIRCPENMTLRIRSGENTVITVNGSPIS